MKAIYTITVLLSLLITQICQAQLTVYPSPQGYAFDDLLKMGVTREPDFVARRDQMNFEQERQGKPLSDFAFNLLRHTIVAGYLQEAIDAAQKFASTIGPKDLVVFIGRDNTLLSNVLLQNFKHLGRDPNALRTLYFSGAPDMKGFELEGDDKQEELRRNLVTQENLSMYLKSLDYFKLSEATGKLFIVDTIDSGAGLNSFLRLLVYYFHARSKKMPDLYFVCPTFIDGVVMEGYAPDGQKVWRYGPIQKKLAFAELPEFGFRKMTVDVMLLPLGYKYLAFAQWRPTKHLVPNYLFPAYKWSKQHFFNMIMEQRDSLMQAVSTYYNGIIKEASLLYRIPDQIIAQFPKSTIEPATYIGATRPKYRRVVAEIVPN